MTDLPTPLREEAEPAAMSEARLNEVREIDQTWAHIGTAPIHAQHRHEMLIEIDRLRLLQQILQGVVHEYENRLLESERALSLEKQRAAGWLPLAGNIPSTTRPYLVAAPAPHRSGLITLRRTFLYIGNGVWGLHGKMEHTRNDITHFRELPPPPDELE